MRQLNREEIVEEFHTTFGSAVNAEWTSKLLELRLLLMKEELKEIENYIDGMCNDTDEGFTIKLEDKAGLLKELADLQYVLSGTAVALGLSLQEAFNHVHKSNMSKLGEAGKPLLRSDGKVLKGPNYKEPDLTKLFE